MNESSDRKKLFETRQAMNGLDQFAEKFEADSLEKDCKEFYRKIVGPVFAKVSCEDFGANMEALPEKAAYPGFKVKDDLKSEFWFWIELRGRRPVVRSRRKLYRSSGLFVVSTLPLSTKQDFEINDITGIDVDAAITYSYKMSFFGDGTAELAGCT